MKTIKKEKKYDYYKDQIIVTVTMVKKVWSIHEDDYDFHVSHNFGEYATKKEAEKNMLKDEEWARRMGDNKYFSVYQEEKKIIKNFIVDEKKAAKRRMARSKKDPLWEEQLLGVRVSWDGTILETIKGNLFDLIEYGQSKLWGGDSFVFRDAEGNIQKFKSIPKVMVEGF